MAYLTPVSSPTAPGTVRLVCVGAVAFPCGYRFSGFLGPPGLQRALWVHYGQAYVVADSWGTDLAASFRGQVNGLCGAAAPGLLFLLTGLHTGHAGFTVDVCASRPAVDDSWEEIVEVPFRVAVPEVTLEEWAGGVSAAAARRGLPGSATARAACAGVRRTSVERLSRWRRQVCRNWTWRGSGAGASSASLSMSATRSAWSARSGPGI
jgi:hypothetical protein